MGEHPEEAHEKSASTSGLFMVEKAVQATHGSNSFCAPNALTVDASHNGVV